MAILQSLVVAVLLLVSRSSGDMGSCNKNDQKALLAIKSFWGNPGVLSTWDPSTPCCGWLHVSCGVSGNRVSRLDIPSGSSSNITGTIPPAVGDLPYLDTLSLTGFPNLAGPIPTALSRLPRLQYLLLGGNHLSGPVPSFLASLRGLEIIDLSNNLLTGTIPPGLSTLRRLRALRLGRNRLTGPIPGSFGELRSGVSLDLRGNRLTGPVPRSLSTVSFENLDLSDNRLSGDASPLFRSANVSFRQAIDVSGNALEFDLGKVELPPKLESLDISHNRIYGRIPRRMAELRELMFLDVSYNRLCGEIPTGGSMGRYDASVYEHNRCLCGTPLPPCKREMADGN